MELLETLKEKISEGVEDIAEIVKERAEEYFNIMYAPPEEANQSLSDLLKRLGIDEEKIREELQEVAGKVAGSFLFPAFQAIVWVLYHSLYWVGFALGWASLLKEYGAQRAAMEMPIRIPDPREVVRLQFMFPELRGAIDDIFRRSGFADDVKELIVLAARRYLDTADIVDAYVKKLLTKDEAFRALEALGYLPSDAEIILESAFNQLSPEQMIVAWFRGLIDDDELQYKLEQRGFRWEDIQLLKQINLALPGIGDLIRFMVRDVFNESVVQRYGYDEEYPEEVEQWLKMQGMDPRWGRAYWRAHWELPSPTMAIEMVRRGIITEEDFDTLLKIADYPRFWRERIRELIFEIPTRVDVRRMYDLGVIDQNKVYETYRKLGYNDEDARALTEFTILDTISEERGKLRTQLLKAFEDGLINENELRQALKDLRYNDQAIDVIVESKKYELERNLFKSQRDIIKEEYMQGLIDEVQAISKLAHLGITSDAITRLVTSWKAEKLKKHRRLTLTQLKELWRKKLITEERIVKELMEMGYTKDDAELLLALIKAGGQIE